MSRNQRIGLLVAAVVIVVAVVIASPGGGDDAESGRQTRTPPDETSSTPATGPRPAAAAPDSPKPQITGSRSAVGGAGGAADFKVRRATTCRIVVSADAPDEIHLHGYDIEKDVGAGQARHASSSGPTSRAIFEIESHVAEDAGQDPLIAKLTVEPD